MAASAIRRAAPLDNRTRFIACYSCNVSVLWQRVTHQNVSRTVAGPRHAGGANAWVVMEKRKAHGNNAICEMERRARPQTYRRNGFNLANTAKLRELGSHTCGIADLWRGRHSSEKKLQGAGYRG
jgi:hypothetical protein